jgi:hypothetical protein
MRHTLIFLRHLPAKNQYIFFERKKATTPESLIKSEKCGLQLSHKGKCNVLFATKEARHMTPTVYASFALLKGIICFCEEEKRKHKTTSAELS